MKIAVYGMGYVGLTAMACLIKDGHSVVGVDISKEKVSLVNSGRCPIFEPGVEELLKLGVENGRLKAVSEVNDEIVDADAAFVCVGTPSDPSGAHDMSYLERVSEQIAEKIKYRKTPLYVVYRSTVKPGSMEDVILPRFKAVAPEGEGVSFEIVYNPEFLRESTAIKDYYTPPKIVFGSRPGVSLAVMDKIYETVDGPVFKVGLKEAEITKFVDNSFHALKVAFANEIGRFCLQADIDAKTVSKIFLSDTKLNISEYYLRPGGAFGGSCLPKDVRALSHFSKSLGLESPVIDSLIKSNESHKRYLSEYVYGLIPESKKVLLVGLSFKVNTDDLRESPNVDLAEWLLGKGVGLSIYEPALKFEKIHGANKSYALNKLPHISRLLVDGESIRGQDYGLVIDAKGGIDIENLGISYNKLVSIAEL